MTSGPGATNTITGIADAMIDSTPIVVIAGQVGTAFLGTDAFQEVDLVGITQPITKWSYQIRRAEDVPWAVARAFYIAKSGRPGPVVLDFAKNAQVEKAEYMPAKLDFIRSYVPVPETDPEAVKAAAELINGAERRWYWWGKVWNWATHNRNCVLSSKRQICPPDVRCWDCRLCQPSIL